MGICNVCDAIRPNDKFYVQNGRRMLRCKSCHIKRVGLRQARVYVKRPVGPAKLPDDKRAMLFKMVADGASMSACARAIDRPYATVRMWKRKGLLTEAQAEGTKP